MIQVKKKSFLGQLYNVLTGNYWEFDKAKSLCIMFWEMVLGFVLLPLSLILHTVHHFNNSYFDGAKSRYALYIGLALYALFSCLFGLSDDGFNFFLGMLNFTLALIGTGIILAIIYGILFLIDKVKENTKPIISEEVKDTIKGKICPLIEWE